MNPSPDSASAPRDFHRSSIDQPSRPSSSQSHKPAVGRGVQHGEPDDARHQPFARPRLVPAHYFWKKPFSLGTLVFVGDLLLTLAPCFFLALSSYALALNGKPITPRGESIEQAAQLGPIIFPIIFAAVIGRLTRTFALWRAERGAPLGILEQLVGSQNLLAAFERAVLLPGLGFLSVAIVFLWALSPLGGQSSLRLLNRAQVPTFGTTPLYYFNNTGDWRHGVFSISEIDFGSHTLPTLFTSLLVSLERTKGSDIWGNVKTPFLDLVPSYKAGDEKDGWYDFSEDEYDSSYSALNGVVISGLKDDIETNFVMDSYYFNLTCTDPTFIPPNAEGLYSNSSLGWMDGLLIHTNRTYIFKDPKGPDLSYDYYMLDTYDNGSFVNPDFSIVYASMSNELSEITIYNCSTEHVFVEADISCEGSTCGVRRIKPSPRKVEWHTDQYLRPTALGSVIRWLSSATSPDFPGRVSPIEWYVSGSDTPFQYDRSDSDVPNSANYHNSSGAQVAERLACLMNTALQLSYQLTSTAHSPSENITALALGQNFSTVEEGVGYSTINTTATTTTRQEAFVANVAWAAITLTLAFILLFCAVVSMIFKYGTRSPDILGFVSSMTRDNPNFDFPGGDKLGGLQRARVLRHVRVQIADVKPWDDEGHITLRNLGHSNSEKVETSS